MIATVLAAILASPSPTPAPPPTPPPQHGRYYLIHVVTTHVPYSLTQSIDGGPFDVYNDCLKLQRAKPFVFTPSSDESYTCEIRYGKQ